ncbi:MAG: hypothetical protein M0Z41_03045 [Peptococcaceae bacterium]|jgi:hypothetical protein|nr:hypothetical protein [Peptococcaceae bacterium]
MKKRDQADGASRIGGGLTAPLGKAVQKTNPGGTMKVSFTAPDGKSATGLVPTENGRRQVIEQQ